MGALLQKEETVRRLQSTVAAYLIAGFLLSGLTISAVIVWGVFEHLTTTHDRALLVATQGRRAAVEQHITRIRVIASQIASRTRAREGLEAYNRGALSAADLVTLSAPILRDAQASASDVLGIIRRDRAGRALVEVGVSFPELRAKISAGGRLTLEALHLDSESVLVVQAPIQSRDGAIVGSDEVVFSIDTLRSLVQAPIELGGQALTALVQVEHDTLGWVVDRNDESMTISRRALATAILQASRGDLGQVFDDDAEGVVLTYAPIWGTNWGLALRMTRADLYAQVWSEIRGVAMWFVLLLLAGALATLRMTHSMSGKVLVRAEQWVSRVAAKEESEHALAMRTKEFETILETVDQGIAMVDSALRVVAVNRRYCELMDVPVELLQPGCPFENVVRYNARRGEHGDCEVETLVIERIAMWRRFERDRFERTRPDGTILQIEIQPVSGGGIVMTYTDVTQQRRSEERAAHIGRLLDESLNEIYVFDAQTLRFIGVNRGALRNLGYTMDELRALTPVDLKPMYSMKQFADLLNPLSTGVEQRLSFITAHRRKDGTDYPVDIHLQCSRSEGRDVFVAMILDVSEREASAAAMRDGEMRYRALYDDNPSMFFTIDSQAKIVSVNRFGAEQLGYTPEELIGSPLTNLTIDSDAVLERTHIKACLRAPGTVHRCDVSKRHRDGRTIWVRESARVVADGVGETMILLVCEDVTETRELSEQLAYFAAHDTLTGLPNRREFENRLDAALESASREDCEHALCYLDLDQFKVVNDTCGHTAGDELLRQIAKLLLGTVRNTDTLARLGGDEFGLLVTHCPLANAERIADTVRALIEDFHFSWEEQSFRIGVSIGVVPITRHSEGRAALMSGADAACYVAKNSGRNRVHVFHRDDVDVARHQGDMGWIGRIQDALECNRLHLDFQAIVPLSSDHVEGEHYEVLLRMIDTDGTLVPPGQFLPVAERYNLAPRIDRWVISTALDWLSTNPAHLEQLSMCSINLSGLSLTDEHFAAFVLAAFRSSGVPPAKICFEITETAAISNLTSAMELVAELRDVGCHFALDDFGSGLSSFGYLKHLPVEFVKIDGMFVKDILDDPIDFAMVRPINEIAHVLGKRTIAEFVENDAILEAVREIGIDFAQGYGVGRPQPLTTLNDKVLSMPRGALNRVCTTSTLHLPCVNAPTSIERNVGAT